MDLMLQLKNSARTLLRKQLESGYEQAVTCPTHKAKESDLLALWVSVWALAEMHAYFHAYVCIHMCVYVE